MIQRRVVVPAEGDRLWRALTDPDEAGRWLGGDLEWVPEEGGRLRFSPLPTGEDAPVLEGRVEEVDPGRYLRFVWWPEDGGPDSVSEVVYQLEPVVPDDPTSAPSTILTVQEAPLVPAGRASAAGPAACSAAWSVAGSGACSAAGSWACSAAGPAAGWSRLDDLQLRMWAARIPAGTLAG